MFSDTNASEAGPYFYRVGVPCSAVTTSGVSWTALYLSTTGAGSIAPFYTGEVLQAGTNYVMTAIPAAGYSFTNWNPINVFTFTSCVAPTNSIVSIVAQPQTNFIEGAVLHFTMQPEQVILTTPGIRTITKGVGWQANFVAQ